MGRIDSGVRDKIVGAAVRLLREEGIQSVAQPQVCKAAGVPQGHLTYYFPRKVDLLAAVARRTLDEAIAEMRRFLSGESWRKAADDARARVTALATHLIENRERTRMLLGVLVEADREPGIRGQLLEGVSMVRSVLAVLFDRPLGDPDVDLLLAALWGLGIQELVFEGQRTPAETAALVARVAALFDRPGATPNELGERTRRSPSPKSTRPAPASANRPRAKRPTKGRRT